MPGTATVSLWNETSEEADLVSPMTTDVTTDLAIVGGGYTGLSTALHAAEQGLDVCFLSHTRSAMAAQGGMWVWSMPACGFRRKMCGASLVASAGRGWWTFWATVRIM